MEEKTTFRSPLGLEGIDRCESIEQLAIFAILGVGRALGWVSSGVQEIIHCGGSARPGRSFVSERLQREIGFFHLNFDRVYASLPRDRKGADPNVYFPRHRIRDALELDFDPRPAWAQVNISDILTIKVPYGPAVDLHLMFNRETHDANFCERDLRHARLIAPMLSATSRRMHAEEHLHLPSSSDDEVGGVSSSCTIHYGRELYLLSRCRSGSLMHMDHFRLLRDARRSRQGEDVIFVKPSGVESPLGMLTKCERTIAKLAAQGLSNKGDRTGSGDQRLHGGKSSEIDLPQARSFRPSSPCADDVSASQESAFLSTALIALAVQDGLSKVARCPSGSGAMPEND